jgi:hypothetical protein
MSPVYSHISNNASLQPAPLPFVPLSAGGLLIPFQPSIPATDQRHGTLPRKGGYPSNLRNFDRIRQQIQQRGQFLESLQKQNYSRVPSLPVVETNAAPSPSFSPPRIAPPVQPARYPSLSSLPTSIAPSPILRTPGMISSESPYARKNDVNSSSSSSGSSGSSSSTAASSARPSSTGRTYAKPFLGDSRTSSLLPGPSNTYRPLQ